MAVFNGTIESQVLNLDTNLVVILPYDRPANLQQKPCKVLYLLHGLSDNAQAWTRYTAIERYARQFGYAVIMPEVNRSFYTDMTYGLDYFTYVSEELPVICEEMFHISSQREDTYIAGLSMGGYGALKCGLSFPERYAGMASFSGALDLRDVIFRSREVGWEDEIIGMIGKNLKVAPENDLKVLAEELAEISSLDRPKIFMTCGKQDFIHSHSADYSKFLTELSIEHTYHEWDGEHEWEFWDKSVSMALSFFEGQMYKI